MENETPNPQLQEADQLYAEGRTDEALTAYRAVVAADDTVAWAHSRIGGILAQRGDYDGAEAALTRALELDPELPQAHSNLGNVHYTRGEYDQAEVRYRAAISLDPSNPLYHENLHAAYKKQRKYNEAISALKQAHRLKRDPATTAGKTNGTPTRPTRRLGCLTLLLPLLVIILATALFA